MRIRITPKLRENSKQRFVRLIVETLNEAINEERGKWYGRYVGGPGGGWRPDRRLTPEELEKLSPAEQAKHKERIKGQAEWLKRSYQAQGKNFRIKYDPRPAEVDPSGEYVGRRGNM